MNLVLVAENEILDDNTVIIDDSRRLKSISSILKSQNNSTLRAGIINGALGYAEIIKINSENGAIKSIVLNTAVLTELPPKPLDLVLICAMQRPKTLKKILQTATAMGVKTFYIIETWKVEKSYWTSSILDEQELKQQLLLGLEQCVDTILPEIVIKRAFKPFVEDELPSIINGRISYVAHPYSKKEEFFFSSADALTLAIGPEGGFTEYEVEKFKDAGFIPISMGKRILRTEFAVTALISLLTSSL